MRLLVWRKGGSSQSIIDTVVDVEDGYLKVLPTALNPETRYRYGWVSGDLTWSVGEFQTAFEADTSSHTVGATACTPIGRAPFPSIAWLSRHLSMFSVTWAT